MKGGVCYGTVRLYYACLYLERYQKAGHSECLEALYTQLLNTVDKTLDYVDEFFQIDPTPCHTQAQRAAIEQKLFSELPL